MDEKNKKKVLIGAAVAGASGLLYLLSRKGGVTPPPPPPPDKATLYGVVTDAANGQKVEGVQVSFSDYADTTDSNGYYLIENIIPGTYEVIFSDPLGRYESAVA